jgi:hypothetical protein
MVSSSVLLATRSSTSLSSAALKMINYEELYLMPALLKAHGSVMGTTFVIILPLGAWCVHLIQSKNGVWIHVAVQLLGWVMMLAGLGLGTKAGTIVDIVSFNHVQEPQFIDVL